MLGQIIRMANDEMRCFFEKLEKIHEALDGMERYSEREKYFTARLMTKFDNLKFTKPELVKLFNEALYSNSSKTSEREKLYKLLVNIVTNTEFAREVARTCTFDVCEILVFLAIYDCVHETSYLEKLLEK